MTIKETKKQPKKKIVVKQETDKPDITEASGNPAVLTPPPEPLVTAVAAEKPPKEIPPPEPEQAPLFKALAESLGFKMEDIAAILQPLITKSVVDTLNQLKLGESINTAATKAVESQLKPIMDKAKALLPALGSGDGADVATLAGGAGDGKQAAGGGIMESLLTAFLQKQITGGGGDGGMGGMAQMFKTMSSFREMISSFYAGPREEVTKEISSMLRLSLSAGADPVKLADALDASIVNASKVQL